jgi:lincosamide nucleotidyltransferase A/C/D/E
MSAGNVLDLLGRLDEHNISYRLDGGWGVDALLGRQTRDHHDLDLVVAVEDVPRIESLLSKHGFAQQPDEPGFLVLRDAGGRQVDLHAVRFDSGGNGWQQLGADKWGIYPAADLEATGIVAGRTLPCITPMLQLRHRLGYDWDENDRHDLALLAERFRIPLPPGFSGS